MTQVLQRTVLFADLRGSTSMYETLGNADATAVVTRSVALLARIVEAHRGQVVKTLGDGLMAVFETPAEGVAAADEMHDSLARIGMADEATPEAANDSQSGDDMAENGGAPTLPPRPAVPLKLQVGLAHGEVVEMSGDVFGDAVNVAAASNRCTCTCRRPCAGSATPRRQRTATC
jgi:adenylate cyclase